MPACEHGHKHAWPKVGPQVICPGERKCGYCDWKTSDRDNAPADAKMDNGAAQALRKHVYEEHTDGGNEDRPGVEVMLYRPGQKKKKGENLSRFGGIDAVIEDDPDDYNEDEVDTSLDDNETAVEDAMKSDSGSRPSLTVRLKLTAKGRLSKIDTQKAQRLLKS